MDRQDVNLERSSILDAPSRMLHIGSRKPRSILHTASSYHDINIAIFAHEEHKVHGSLDEGSAETSLDSSVARERRREALLGTEGKGLSKKSGNYFSSGFPRAPRALPKKLEPIEGMMNVLPRLRG